ncbi:MAG: methionine adenosyltransferase [Planctomycetota bacterium]
MPEKKLFSSESVAKGHPDKVADQISDGVLDAILAEDPKARVACETLVTTGMALVAGEITTNCYVHIPDIVRETTRSIGYTKAEYGFDCDSCAVLVAIDKQSPDIAMGVDENKKHEQGAGDQGMMFGFACSETPELMPAPLMFSHQMMMRLEAARESKDIPWLRPDGKGQFTVEYEGNRPVRVHTAVLSAQHDPEVDHATIRKTLIEKVIKPVIPAALLHDKINFHVNPTGRFVVGGPHGDSGLTGRKIIVDTYGGMGRHGGGAFSGKDPSKVDRSAAYMARHVAKNIVAAKLAERCEVQLAYAIGVAEPVSVRVDTYGTGEVDETRLEKAVREVFGLKPRQIIEYLDLLKPIYRKTAAHGHFGRNEKGFTWEKTNRVKDLRTAVGL